MDCGVSLMLKFSPVAVLILPVVYEPVPSVVDRSALPVTFMVPKSSPSALCGVEFSALPLYDGRTRWLLRRVFRRRIIGGEI